VLYLGHRAVAGVGDRLQSLLDGDEGTPAGCAVAPPARQRAGIVDQRHGPQVFQGQPGGLGQWAGGRDRIAAFAQRPVTAEALGGVVSEVPAEDVPRWQVVATEDNAVPAEPQRLVAHRVGAEIIEADCGRDVATARPKQVLEAVLAAAAAVGA